MAVPDGSLFRRALIRAIPPRRAAQAIRQEAQTGGGLGGFVQTLAQAKAAGDMLSPLIDAGVRSYEESEKRSLGDAAEARVRSRRGLQWDAASKHRPTMMPDHKGDKGPVTQAAPEEALAFEKARGEFMLRRQERQVDSRENARKLPSHLADPHEAYRSGFISKEEYEAAKEQYTSQGVAEARAKAEAGYVDYAEMKRRMLEAYNRGDYQAAKDAMDAWERSGNPGLNAKGFERIGGGHIARARERAYAFLRKFPTQQQQLQQKRKIRREDEADQRAKDEARRRGEAHDWKKSDRPGKQRRDAQDEKNKRKRGKVLDQQIERGPIVKRELESRARKQNVEADIAEETAPDVVKKKVADRKKAQADQAKKEDDVRWMGQREADRQRAQTRAEEAHRSALATAAVNRARTRYLTEKDKAAAKAKAEKTKREKISYAQRQADQNYKRVEKIHQDRTRELEDAEDKVETTKAEYDRQVRAPQSNKAYLSGKGGKARAKAKAAYEKAKVKLKRAKQRKAKADEALKKARSKSKAGKHPVKSSGDSDAQAKSDAQKYF